MYNWMTREVSDKEREIEDAAAREEYKLGYSEFFTRSVAQNFDMFNTVGSIIGEHKIITAEEEAGTYHDVRDLLPSDDAVTFDVDALETNPNAITKEEFEKQGYDRKQKINNPDGTVSYGPSRIQWNPQMTPQRAKLLAENLDARDYEYQILDRSNTNALYSALGFGAGLVASLPDPINLIPVFGQAKVGAGIGARMLAGARGGLLGTMLADSILMPQAYQKGEDVGFGTVALDLVFGGVIGGGIGAAGGWLHNRRVRKMAGEENSLREALVSQGFDDVEAGTRAHDVINCLADTKQRSEMSAAVRHAIGGKDRESVGRILDRALSALVDDGDMDVKAWSEALGIKDIVSAHTEAIKPKLLAEMLEAVEKEGVPQVALGRLSADRVSVIQDTPRVGDMDIVRDGRLVLPSNVAWTLFNKDNGLIKSHADANQIADVIMQAVRFDRDAPIPEGGKNRARKLRRVQDKLIESGFVEKGEDGKFRINAETSIGSERKRLISEMESAGVEREKAEAYAKLHVAQALAFQKAYGIDAVKALRNRGFSITEQPFNNIGPDGAKLWQGDFTGEERLLKDAQSWGAQIHDLLNGGKSPRSEITMMTHTPLVMQLLGAKDLPVKIAPSKIKSLVKKHGMSENVLNQVPAAMTEPVMVFKSATNGGDLLFVLAIKDRDNGGATVNVPVSLKLKDSGGYEANIVTSIFGRRRGDPIKGEPDNKWFVTQIENGNLLYKDNKKARDWARTSKLQLPGANSRTISGGSKIFSNEDLVKLKSKNVAFYQFLGERGASALDKSEEATARMDNLSIARDMENSGKGARAIKLATGWERGADGKWRYEIDDSMYRVFESGDAEASRTVAGYDRYLELRKKADDAFLGLGDELTPEELAEYSSMDRVALSNAVSKGVKDTSHEVRLSDVLDAPELFSAYPEFANIPVLVGKLPNGINAISDSIGIQISDRMHGDSFRSSIIHEVQHKIQAKEGFANGGSVSSFKTDAVGIVNIGDKLAENRIAKSREIFESAPPELKEKIRELNKAYLDKDFNKADLLESSLSPEEFGVWDEYHWALNEAKQFKDDGRFVTPEEAYRSIAGEVESRNVQSRSRMSMEERRKSLASTTEDVSREDQIFIKSAWANSESLPNAARGMVDFSNAEPGSAGETYRIFLSPDADASTIPHESAHIFLRETENAIAIIDKEGGNAEQLKADLRELRRFAGVAEDGKLDADAYRKLQEATARGFEQYLSEGVAPNPALADVFSRMKNWLKSVYADIKAYVAGTDGVELKQEVREVFDRWLDADRAEATPDIHDASVPERDFSRPAPKPTIMPDDVAGTEKAIDDMLNGIDGSPLDYEAARLAQEGDILPEHAALLNEANEELSRADIVENAALETLECIIGSI